MKTFFLISGEASGDLHASRLIRALRSRESDARFVGFGGYRMQAEGCELIQHYREMSYMGFVDVALNAHKVCHNFALAKQSLLRIQPEHLILVDYPSFNLRIARFCRRHLPDTRITYYIPPKAWAWKQRRVHAIARLTHQVLGIFPFEEDFYSRYGYRCTYVGNPTVESVSSWQQAHPNEAHVVRQPIIALLPGSRPSEIRHCLPVMLRAARRVANGRRIVVTAAPGIEDSFYTPYLEDETLTRDTYALVSCASAAVVNSGTATLEAALLHCPQVAVYYVAGSSWLGWLRPIIFRTPWFTLPNIIARRTVIKELVGNQFREQTIAEELALLLHDEAYKRDMLVGYEHISCILGTDTASHRAAELI